MINFGSKKILLIGVVLWVIGYGGFFVRDKYTAKAADGTTAQAQQVVSSDPFGIGDTTAKVLYSFDFGGKMLIAAWAGTWLSRKVFPKQTKKMERKS